MKQTFEPDWNCGVNKEIELKVNQPLLNLMESCETFSVAGCCGVDAFDVSEEPIRAWVKTAGLDQSSLAREQIQLLIAEVAVSNTPVNSDRFNACWSAQECINWLNEWKTVLEVVLHKTE